MFSTLTSFCEHLNDVDVLEAMTVWKGLFVTTETSFIDLKLETDSLCVVDALLQKKEIKSVKSQSKVWVDP